MKWVLNLITIWLWMVFCITDNSCNFPMMVDLFWKFFSKMLNYLFSSDRPAKYLQNIPLNTCCKTNLFNYLIITIILWRLSFVLLWAVVRKKSHKTTNLLYHPFTHIYMLYVWAVTHHTLHAVLCFYKILLHTHTTSNQCHSRQVYDLIM